MIAVELEVVDEFSPVFFFLFTKFKTDICRFFDLLSRSFWLHQQEIQRVLSLLYFAQIRLGARICPMLNFSRYSIV